MPIPCACRRQLARRRKKEVATTGDGGLLLGMFVGEVEDKKTRTVDFLHCEAIVARVDSLEAVAPVPSSPGVSTNCTTPTKV